MRIRILSLDVASAPGEADESPATPSSARSFVEHLAEVGRPPRVVPVSVALPGELALLLAGLGEPRAVSPG